MNVAEPILRVLARDPGRAAVVEPGGRSVDFAELRRRIVAFGRHLQERGLRPGDRVVLQVPNGVEFATSALAVLLTGGVPVLCEPGLGDAVYLSRVRAAGSRWLVVHPLVARLNRIPGARGLLRRYELDVPPLPPDPTDPERIVISPQVMQRLTARLPPAAELDPVRRTGEQDGVLIFTGGTTSVPKGVRLTHGALSHYLTNIRSVIEDVPVDRFLADTPQQVLYALRLGRTAYTTKGRRRRRARHVLRLVLSGKVDCYFGSPYIWMEMMALTGPGREQLPPTLKTVLLGSAPVTPDFLRQLRGWLHPETRVLAIYGLTEAGPVCIGHVHEKLAWDGEGDLVGAPLPGVELEIDGAARPADVGEVVVRSPALYAGYLEQPARAPDEGLRTGDLGRLVEADGRRALVLMGRVKDMIIRRGVNIYPGTLEATIRSLSDGRGPLLRECALIGLWNEGRQDEELVLCVEPAAGRPAALDLVGLARRVAEAVGSDGAPDHVLLCDPLPVTGRQNKVDKQALRAWARERLGLGALPGEGAAGPAADWDRLPGARMPFDWDALGRKYRLLLRSERDPVGVAGQLAFRAALWAVGQAGWALDELTDPRWRDAPLAGPLFILGHQRSGTTFLQRLLAEDKTHARALALHEQLLPSCSFQRGLAGLAALDGQLGGGLGRRFGALQDRLFGPMDDIHRLRFDAVEEDEFVLWTIFASVMCANDAPSSAELPGLDDLRNFHQWSVDRQIAALGYYRACLLKKLRREPAAAGTTGAAAAPWVVSKNPAFTHKVPELRRVFPDARFVCLVRNPLETIPSRLSMIREIWRHRFSGFREMTPRQVETIVADSVRTYLAAERDLPKLPPDRRITVTYDNLVARPWRVVERIYRRFALPADDPTLAAALRKLTGRQRPHHSNHRYSLAEFGLDEARLRRELAPVFERHGFE
ncbi:MAG: AMP-binding protein [bacterium]